MKIIKMLILWLILLILMVLSGTFILKIFDLILKIGYENIWQSGFRVGFIAWLGVLVNNTYHYFKNNK